MLRHFTIKKTNEGNGVKQAVRKFFFALTWEIKDSHLICHWFNGLALTNDTVGEYFKCSELCNIIYNIEGQVWVSYWSINIISWQQSFNIAVLVLHTSIWGYVMAAIITIMRHCTTKDIWTSTCQLIFVFARSADPSIMIKNWDLNTVTLMLHSISSESVGTVQSRFYNTLLLLIISCSIHTRKKSSEDCSIIKNPCIISCSIILFKHSRIRIRHWEDCFIAASFFNRCIALYQWCIIRGDHMDKHFE